jgi:hypothetical protein
VIEREVLDDQSGAGNEVFYHLILNDSSYSFVIVTANLSPGVFLEPTESPVGYGFTERKVKPGVRVIVNVNRKHSHDDSDQYWFDINRNEALIEALSISPELGKQIPLRQGSQATPVRN